MTPDLPSMLLPISNEAPLPPLRDWPLQALAMLEDEYSVVRIIVLEVRGSAPREAGASMLVGSNRLYGTVGGGHLEWQALQSAYALLASRDSSRIEQLVLGTELGQCCGGVVTLGLARLTQDDLPMLRKLAQPPSANAKRRREQRLETRLGGRRVHFKLRPANDGEASFSFETARDTLIEDPAPAQAPVWLYGAGHVGQALMRVLADLPFALTWIDSRTGLFPTVPAPGLTTITVSDPAATVARAPAGCRFLVLTHSHDLDYELVRAALDRNDFAFLGLIGSASKAAKFRARLARDGYAPDQVGRLTCPVGATVASKWPAAIAVSIAAQLLQDIDTPVRAQPFDDGCNGRDCNQCGQKIRRALPR